MAALAFDLQKTDALSAARAGKIITDHGYIETPMFMPVGTIGSVKAIIWSKSMKKLDEQDLFPFFILWDIWMFFYYIMFAPAIWKKPAKKWN